MKYKRIIAGNLFLSVLLISTGACSKEENKPGDGKENIETETGTEAENETETETGIQVYADYEDVAVSFYGNKQDMHYAIADNPGSDSINSSSRCGRIYSTADKWELLYSEKLDGTFDFDESTVFTVKVRSSHPGNVYLKIEHPDDWQQGQLEVQQELTVTDEWTELSFDFKDLDIAPDTFGKIILLFDAGGEAPGTAWYFDDLKGPPLDRTPSLMQRYENNPVLRPVAGTWYGVHIANAAILSPDESPDGKWRLYARGSGYVPEYHDQIGLFTQEANDFSPYGPWDEYTSNPVISHGPAGSYDDKGMLDCAPVVGPSGAFKFFFNAKTTMYNTGALAGASSSDGGLSFTKFDQVLKQAIGSSDAIYHNGEYYIFYGDGNWNGTKFAGPLQLYVMRTDDPEVYREDQVSLVLPVGGGPGDFDSESVNGSRIFRLNNKWFMVYQGSSKHFDFPERFHVAYSDDLINWTKVQNDQPFFTRGDAGEWDQGGIWYGEVFEHEGTLYMYYEGWGCDCVIPDRNKPYFAYGISQTGAARVSVSDFLDWCGL
ncbi:glycoside hydrolase family protein [Sinomicrobium soli]|uniref:hypothetical protein n=1 Tax=Sinomicrobium sp. N-1-3-6 TaxID=2219864 RepID=UPI000DCB8A48|nr:hypothetical protein [Sinomicrobium sp. N-1-3-6]RAV28211.1 hypothetical protein DN748_14665 [Sinomicrobium sp. N-1-3-6]